MSLKKWHELPVELRRSESKRWNYLVNELTGTVELVDSETITTGDSSESDTESP